MTSNPYEPFIKSRPPPTRRDKHARPAGTKPGGGKVSALFRVAGSLAALVWLAGWLISARSSSKGQETDPPSPADEGHQNTPDRMSQAEKSGWDKASVIVQAIGGLAIFISLAGLLIGVLEFNEQQKMNAKNLLTQQNQTTLANYFDEMSDLVLNHRLAAAIPDSSFIGIAIARTATALRELSGDGVSEGDLIRYLWEAGLILGPKPVLALYHLDLNGAVVQNANLYHAYLTYLSIDGALFNGAVLDGTNLSYSDLVGTQLKGASIACLVQKIQKSKKDQKICAELYHAYLIRADLKGANLTGADLRQADLDGANLSGAVLADANLQGALYNTRQEKVVNERGNPVINMPTRWPKDFDPAAAGATCDDCRKRTAGQ